MDLSASATRCVCLRHDVDGLLWQPAAEDNCSEAFEHKATFNALGYVQASKRQLKYATCASDFSYVALCDCVRHVYIYWHAVTMETSLRNRMSGQNVTKIAKQQVVSLDASEETVGFQAADEWLFVLTSNTLYVLKVAGV